MATDRQVQANRNNARKSTGPVTTEGKRRSSFNSRKHGLFSGACLLPDENATQFDEFADDLRDNLKPEGSLEDLLTDRIISSSWRLRRLLGVEVNVFQDQRYQEGDFPESLVDKGLSHAFARDAFNGDSFARLNRYEASLERSILRTLHELQRIQALRQGRDVQLPIAVDLDISSGPVIQSIHPDKS